ncbi:MAG TPA: FecR domain-containing protein [bacterium]|nr:FecR domain-containing protein [bacterium]HQP99111.1 FecR domain-containing protein [bacterium]
MAERLSEQQERILSDRFDQAGSPGDSSNERETFAAYEDIRSALRSLRPPEIDKATLSRRLAQEMGVRTRWFEEYRQMWFFRPVALSVLTATVCVLLVVSVIGYFFHIPTPGQTTVTISQTGTISPRLARVLEKGKFINMQDAVDVELSDHTRLHCSPGTRLAVQYEKERKILLAAGEITVHAAPVAGSTLTVETPLVNVDVVGTVFRVKVIP